MSGTTTPVSRSGTTTPRRRFSLGSQSKNDEKEMAAAVAAHLVVATPNNRSSDTSPSSINPSNVLTGAMEDCLRNPNTASVTALMNALQHHSNLFPPPHSPLYSLNTLSLFHQTLTSLLKQSASLLSSSNFSSPLLPPLLTSATLFFKLSLPPSILHSCLRFSCTYTPPSILKQSSTPNFLVLLASAFANINPSSSSILNKACLGLFWNIIKHTSILGLPPPVFPYPCLQSLTSMLLANVTSSSSSLILGVLSRQPSSSIIFSSLENSRQRNVIRVLLNVMKQGEEVECVKALHLLIVLVKGDEELRGKVFSRNNVWKTCDLVTRYIGGEGEGGNEDVRFMSVQILNDMIVHFTREVEDWEGFKPFIVGLWKRVIGGGAEGSEGSVDYCLVKSLIGCSVHMRGLCDKVLAILITRSNNSDLRCDRSEGSILVIDRILKLICKDNFDYVNVMGVSLLKYVLLMRSDKEEIVNVVKNSLWKALEAGKNAQLLKVMFEKLTGLTGKAYGELEGHCYLSVLSLITSSQHMCNVILTFEGMKDGGEAVGTWCKEVETFYKLKVGGVRGGKKKKKDAKTSANNSRIARQSVSPDGGEREDEFEFKFSTPRSTLKMNLDERLREREEEVAEEGKGKEEEEGENAVKVGVDGVDNGVSAKLVVNARICCGIFLARMCYSGGKKENDVLRRRRDTVVSVANDYFTVGRVRELVAFGLKQGFDKGLTQNCLLMVTLMMRVGGFGGGGLVESLFEGCRADGERERKIREDRVKMDEEAREARDDLAKLRRELNTVKYDRQQKQIGWEKELAKAKADAAQGASELASYHKSAREEAEKGLDEKNAELEECKILNEDLKKRLEEATMEISRTNAVAQSALAEALESQQRAVKLETEGWEAKEKARKLQEELTGLESRIRGLERTHENEESVISHAAEAFQRQQGLIAYINQLSGNPTDMKNIGPPPEELMNTTEWAEVHSSPFVREVASLSTSTKII
ncbi:hypothetical protein TrST_g12795 [Triparma strigata]|uniref:Uncharacterized protein n=1 Tax=Triparma strigata TaxID=1606541 RepID=A0A9W7B674_9STRA|nr:hypothetical protein TrST_g12795 [Triparma strigata]